MKNSNSPNDLDSLTKKMNDSFTHQTSTDSVKYGSDSQAIDNAGQPWSPELVSTLSIGILLFTAFVLVLITFIMVNRKLAGSYALKLYTIVIIISFSSFLCVTGYNDTQLAPILGLFGAIAGYLLGKDESRRPENGNNQSDKEPE